LKRYKEGRAMEGIEFYRCAACNRAGSKWDIREKHGCPMCAGNKLRKSNLTIIEKIIQVFKHPKVWRWNEPSY
jgi:hypothetical protein